MATITRNNLPDTLTPEELKAYVDSEKLPDTLTPEELSQYQQTEIRAGIADPAERSTAWGDIGPRFAIRGVFPEDEGRRASYLKSMGIPTQEPGMMTNIPETIADVGETAAPWVKYGLGALGAAAGGAAAGPGALTGVPEVLGGAAGYMAADKGFRALAGGQSTISSDIEAGITGAGLEIGSKMLKNIPGVSKELGSFIADTPPGRQLIGTFDNFGKWARRHVLTRVSKIPEQVVETIDSLGKNGWRYATGRVKQIAGDIVDMVDRRILPAIDKYKMKIGEDFAKEVHPIINNIDNTIDFFPAGPDVVNVLRKYRMGTDRLNTEEINELINLLSPFFKLNRKNFTAVTNSKALAVPGTTNLPSEFITNGAMSLRKAYDILNETFDDFLEGKYPKVGAVSGKNTTIIAAAKELRRTLKSAIHQSYPDIKIADLKYEAGSDIWEYAKNHFGNKDSAVQFVARDLLTSNVGTQNPRNAFSSIDAARPGGYKFLEDAKTASAIEALKGEPLTSGFAFGVLPKIAEVGGGGGATGNAAAEAVRLGQTGMLTRLNAAKMLARMETLRDSVAAGKVAAKATVSGIWSSIPKNVQTTAVYKILGKPVADAVKDLSEQFGLEVDAMELK